MPPGGYKTDWSVMDHVLAMGESKTEAMNKFNNGGYYVKRSKYSDKRKPLKKQWL